MQRELPFPQNKNFNIFGVILERRDVIFIPVINQPLSANKYYISTLDGNAFTSRKAKNMNRCGIYSQTSHCLKLLNPNDSYQQFEIQHARRRDGLFLVKSVASDGNLPCYFWTVKTGFYMYKSNPSDFDLPEATGLDETLHFRLPKFDFPLSTKTSTPVVVGKWLVPSMFINYTTVQDQSHKCRYYVMTLEQHWEQIYSGKNNNNNAPPIVDADLINVEPEAIKLGGNYMTHRLKDEVNYGIMWFEIVDDLGGKTSLGLSLGIVERMEWEQNRFGFVNKPVEAPRGGLGEWKKYGLYILVERFAVKRLDGSLVLTHDFRHTQHLKCKRE